MITRSSLRPDEMLAFELRGLYESFGYTTFKMNKFEEYSFYANNKDFLVGDRILTFTNLDGRLMALKPDVTMSIIKNQDVPQGEVRKFYYNENVYRENRNATTFEELPQIGLECIGSLGFMDIAEVLILAGETLKYINEEFVLTLSEMTFVEESLGGLDLSGDQYVRLLNLIRRKNRDGIRKVAGRNGLAEEDIELLCALPGLYGDVPETVEKARPYARTEAMQASLARIEELYAVLAKNGLADNLQLDLSMVNDIDYYNGIIFRGHLPGVAASVLGGGQYDRAMKVFGKRGGGIGFGLYLSELTRSEETASEDSEMLTIALPKGRLGDQVYKTLEKAGYECPAYNDNNRKLILENKDRNVRYILVKPSDVAVYVEHKAADIGIVGKDILLESGADVYELLDLGLGKCRMCVAGRNDYVEDTDRTLRVATKFVNVAKRYYAGIGREIEIIKLNGSIELAPLLGLSDVIVDIVESGKTLKENNLSVLSEIFPISARFIANRASYKFKGGAIDEMLSKLTAAINEEETA
jgi:ATP phosphoribosyltransferase regulatory subunit